MVLRNWQFYNINKKIILRSTTMKKLIEYLKNPNFTETDAQLGIAVIICTFILFALISL